MKRKNTTVSVLLVLAIIFMINLVSQRISFRQDLTEDGIYTLSKPTKDILKNLQQTVTVTAYFSEDLPPDVQRVRQDMVDMLIEYNRLSGGKIVYRFVNPNESEEIEQEAMQKGIEPVLINVREKDQMKQQKAYLGASLIMGEGNESIPFLQPGGAMEYALTTAIKKLSVSDKPYVAMIVGHGEPTLDQLFQVMQSMSVLYNFQAFKMDSTITDIPDNYKTIAIVNPTDSIPPAHLAAFDRFLNRGGKVYVGINRVNGDLQNAYGSAVTTGLETWLRSKGIEVDEYFVADANCGSVTVQQVQGMMRYSSQVSFPYLPVSLKFADHPVTRGLESVYFPFVSPVLFRGDTSSYRFTPVVFSGEKAAMLRAPQFFDIRKQWTQQDFPQGNIVLAGAVEKKEGSKWEPMMFVAGDGDFAINGPREQAQQLMPDNVNLMVNAIDWLSDETGLIELRTRGIMTRPIDPDLSDSTKTLLKWMNFLLPILLIIVFGIYRFWRMKAIRKRRMEERYE